MPKEPNNELALANRGDADRPLQLSAVDSTTLIDAAIRQGSAMEVIKELRVMRSEDLARQAKSNFDAAMASFQSECPVIVKSKAVMNKDGRSVRYHYAPLDSILAQVRPYLDKHSFIFQFTTCTTGTRVKVTCKVECAGHSETSEFESPIDPQAFMNEQQKFAAALTYAKRYAFCNAFGILTADEDVDGETKKPKPPGPQAQDDISALKTELWNLLKPVRGSKPDWHEANSFLWRNDILDAAAEERAPNLTADKFRDVIAKAREILATDGH